MGKSTITGVCSNSKLLNYQRVPINEVFSIAVPVLASISPWWTPDLRWKVAGFNGFLYNSSLVGSGWLGNEIPTFTDSWIRIIPTYPEHRYLDGGWWGIVHWLSSPQGISRSGIQPTGDISALEGILQPSSGVSVTQLRAHWALTANPAQALAWPGAKFSGHGLETMKNGATYVFFYGLCKGIYHDIPQFLCLYMLQYLQSFS